jgi:hypothetical protein
MQVRQMRCDVAIIELDGRMTLHATTYFPAEVGPYQNVGSSISTAHS